MARVGAYVMLVGTYESEDGWYVFFSWEVVGTYVFDVGWYVFSAVGAWEVVGPALACSGPGSSVGECVGGREVTVSSTAAAANVAPAGNAGKRGLISSSKT